jgi:FkbM family methyltransferase
MEHLMVLGNKLSEARTRLRGRMFKLKWKAIWLYRDKIRNILYRVHGIAHDTVTVKTMQGLLTMSTRDKGVGAPLYKHKQYEYGYVLRVHEFLDRSGFIPATGLNVLDIGANIGVISIGMVLSGQADNAIAIEPAPGNFSLLSRNIKQNELTDKMICLQYALGDKASTLTMELSPTNLGDHRIHSDSPITNDLNEPSRQKIQVQSLPLDDVMKLPEVLEFGAPSPSLMWIDVQGHEGYVFKGADEVLEGGITTVSEIHPLGILRAGMSLEEFADTATDLWSDFWVEENGHFVQYPIADFQGYIKMLHDAAQFENVIFTRS